MEKTKEDLGDLIRRKRDAHGWTQSDLAEISGVPFRTIQKIESGESAPRFDTIRPLALALGITTEELWGNPKPSLALSSSAIQAPLASDVVSVGERLLSVSPRRRAIVLAFLFDDPALLPVDSDAAMTRLFQSDAKK